ncbi:MAG: hypothetical protein HZA54_09615 [Planctomycetes bacterium]|nr:hypothetical protein [Planctomycetota bacterium]
MARPPARELWERLQHLQRILEGRGLTVAVMGGIAVNAWTIPAPTYDIDLCVDLREEDVPGLIRVLEAEGFVPPPTAWIESVGTPKFREFSVSWPFQDGLIPADIYLATQPFQREALRRSRRIELAQGVEARILTPEDLLIYKLIAWRNKDRAAIDRLFAVQNQLDWAYVREWAESYGVMDRLRDAWRDAAIAPPPAGG